MAESITSASLSSFGEVVPPGNYVAKVDKITAEESETSGTQWVSIGLVILNGEAEGLTTSISIFPKVTKSPKNGKYYSRGIFEATSTASAWGSPLPEFPLDDFIGKTTLAGIQMLAKLLGQSFKKAGSPRVMIRVTPEKQQVKDENTGKWVDKKNDDGTQAYRNRTTIYARASAAPSVTEDSEGPATKEEPVSYV